MLNKNLIQEIDLQYKNLDKIPDLREYINLKKLYIGENNISFIDEYYLPNSLEELDISFNNLTELNINLQNLKKLYCGFNQIKNIKITSPLEQLDISYNNINNIDFLYYLPIKTLICSFNKLITLNYLPHKLIYLQCSGNPLVNITLPYSLKTIFYYGTELKNIDNFFIWKGIIKLKKVYYKIKYGKKLIKYFYNFIKKRNEKLNNELLYSPNLPFYKNFWSLETLKYSNNYF